MIFLKVETKDCVKEFRVSIQSFVHNKDQSFEILRATY